MIRCKDSNNLPFNNYVLSFFFILTNKNYKETPYINFFL